MEKREDEEQKAPNAQQQATHSASPRLASFGEKRISFALPIYCPLLLLFILAGAFSLKFRCYGFASPFRATTRLSLTRPIYSSARLEPAARRIAPPRDALLSFASSACLFTLVTHSARCVSLADNAAASARARRRTLTTRLGAVFGVREKWERFQAFLVLRVLLVELVFVEPRTLPTHQRRTRLSSGQLEASEGTAKRMALDAGFGKMGVRPLAAHDTCRDGRIKPRLMQRPAQKVVVRDPS